jgi:sugar-specific transcriptional regulator TrmB
MIDQLSYLGGIIDGEGTIGIYKRSTYYVPGVSISNTNETLINYLKEILDNFKVEYCVEYQDRGSRKNAKPAWTIRVESKPRVRLLLSLVSDYLIAKKQQARLVAEWCAFEGRRRKLQQTDLDLISNVRTLNARGRVR